MPAEKRALANTWTSSKSRICDVGCKRIIIHGLLASFSCCSNIGREINTGCIGTNLTNDLGYEPLQIVIKMVRCNGQPVAKLSDTPSKNMCDDEKYLAYLRQVFEIPSVT